MLAALATVAALAPAGTIAVEGTELVYRSAPGASADVVIQHIDGPFIGVDGNVTPGAGCERRFAIVCPLDGITAVRVVTGGGPDKVGVLVPVPVFVDLGAGNDRLTARGTHVVVATGPGRDTIEMTAAAGTIDAGPGDDELLVSLADGWIGPLSVLGGDGDDTLEITGHAKPGVSVDAGAGDDRIAVAVYGSAPGFDLACGPGDDHVRLRIGDRPGDGCAPHVTVGAPDRVGRPFRADDLSGPAAVAVTYRRRPGGGRRPAEVIARGTTVARAADPLHVPLKTTRAGRRWIDRTDNLKLYVSLITRRGGDRNAYAWDARLAPRTRTGSARTRG